MGKTPSTFRHWRAAVLLTAATLAVAAPAAYAADGTTAPGGESTAAQAAPGAGSAAADGSRIAAPGAGSAAAAATPDPASSSPAVSDPAASDPAASGTGSATAPEAPAADATDPAPAAEPAEAGNLTVKTALPTPTPEPGSSLPFTTVLWNESGEVHNVRFSIVLPDNGYTFDLASGSLNCWVGAAVSTAVGDAEDSPLVCPQLSYDAATRTVSGTIPSMGPNDQLTIEVGGFAGVVPGEYTVTSTAVADGDPAEGTRTSSQVFDVANTRVSPRGEVTLTLPEGTSLSEDLVVPAHMVCLSSGTRNVEVRVAAGSTTGSVVLGDPVWRNDSCTVTFDQPAAPAGFTWGSFLGSPVTIPAVDDGSTAHLEASLQAVPTTSPTPTPTTPAPTGEPSPEPTATTPVPTSSPAPTTTSPGGEGSTPAPSTTAPAGSVPGPGDGGGQGGAGDGASGGIGLHTGFDQPGQDAGPWWIVGGLAALAAVSAAGAWALRRRTHR